MDGYEFLRILWAVFLGLGIIAAGVLALTSKGEPGMGFRIGYTYLSERAKRRANRVSGVGTVLTGLFLVLLSPFLRFAWLVVVLLAGLGTTTLLAYLAAKREYGLEELSEEVRGRPGRRIEPPSVGMCIALQSAFVGVSLALLTRKLPGEEGTALITFVQLFLLALTFLVSRPLFFQLSPKFKGEMALGFAKAMAIVSGIITLQLAAVALKPDASPLVGIIMLLVALGAVFYAAFISLTSAHEEGYY